MFVAERSDVQRDDSFGAGSVRAIDKAIGRASERRKMGTRANHSLLRKGKVMQLDSAARCLFPGDSADLVRPGVSSSKTT